MQIEDYKPTAPAPAHVEHSENTSTLVYVRKLRQPPERVWAALTDAEQLPKWAPYRPSRNLTETGAVSINMIDGSTPEVYESEVKEVIPNEVLEYSWRESLLRWELAASESGTTLTLRQTVENPEWIPPSAAGWHMCLDIAEMLMDGNEIGPIIGEVATTYGWSMLAEYYGKLLGDKSDDDNAAEDSPEL